MADRDEDLWARLREHALAQDADHGPTRRAADARGNARARQAFAVLESVLLEAAAAVSAQSPAGAEPAEPSRPD